MDTWKSNLVHLNNMQSLRDEIADLRDAIARGEIHLMAWLERSRAEYKAMASVVVK